MVRHSKFIYFSLQFEYYRTKNRWEHCRNSMQKWAFCSRPRPCLYHLSTFLLWGKNIWDRKDETKKDDKLLSLSKALRDCHSGKGWFKALAPITVHGTRGMWFSLFSHCFLGELIIWLLTTNHVYDCKRVFFSHFWLSDFCASVLKTNRIAFFGCFFQKFC